MTEDKSMKEQLLELVEGLEKEGINFDEESISFQWSYKELPFHKFKLVVSKEDQAMFDLGELH